MHALQWRPRLQHEQAVKQRVRYLKRTSSKGLTLQPDTSSHGLECHTDADFAGGFREEYLELGESNDVIVGVTSFDSPGAL